MKQHKFCGLYPHVSPSCSMIITLCHGIWHCIVILVIIYLVLGTMPCIAIAESGMPGVGYQQASCDNSNIPDVMEAGQTYPVTISFRNTGLVNWAEGREHYGLVLESGEGFTIDPSFILIPEGMVVTSGQSHNFACIVQAPQKTGEVPVSFAMSVRSGSSTHAFPVFYEKNIVIIPQNGISSPDLGSVHLISTPPGAAVALNGQQYGASPLIIPDISPGTYTLNVTLAGYTDRSVLVDVTAGDITSVILDLSDPYGMLVTVENTTDESILSLFLSHLHLIVITIVLVLTAIVVLNLQTGGRRDRIMNRIFRSSSSQGEGGGETKARSESGRNVAVNSAGSTDTSVGSVSESTSGKYGKLSGGFNRRKEEKNMKGTIAANVTINDKTQKNEASTPDKINTGNDDVTDIISDSELYLGFPHELRDRYEPLAIVGTDSFTRVYQVRRKADEKIRAVKLPQNRAPPSEILQKEISVWHSLKNPRILPVYRFEYEPVMYLEMEYLDGVPAGDSAIHSFAEFKKPINPKLAVQLIRGVAEGIAYLHSLGVRHYHLHQGNILLTSSRNPMISGLARGKNEFGFAVGHSDPATADASYLAPEQRYPEKYGTCGMKTDIYQTGVILYELLTGVSPYSMEAQQIAGHNASERDEELLVLPSEINSSLAPFDPILIQMLTWDKKKRYRTIKEFLQDLLQIPEQ